MSAGRVLAGRYELIRIIGRGGMAEVYAARDRSLGREVAVKLLLERYREDESFTRRFQDEARHVARLNHPNIVAVYDTGQDEGQPYIVMELVSGRSLQEAITQGGLTEDRALDVAAEVCAALGYAHERGLIHRDIKPGNILLADDGSVKVTDFGIARAVDNETVTRTAAVLGTAAYLSPEQAQGLEVDPRSDVYSLGVVLYETLTGLQPFQGASAVTVAYQHVQESPRPPRELDPSISPAAEAITMRALAKNPANRYATAMQMRDDLLHARVGGPVVAPAVLTADETALLTPTATSQIVRGEGEVKRRRGAVYGLLAVLALVAIGGLLWAISSMLGGSGASQVAVPDLFGLTVEQAERTLETRNLVLGRTDDEETEDAEPGTIVGQNPERDTLVAEGSAVNVRIAVGPTEVVVPDLVEQTEEEALRLIREGGVRRGTRSQEFHPTIPAGSVISQDPPAGTSVREGTTVDYVVSQGEELVTVRPVGNRSEADAISILEGQQGLIVRIEREFSDSVAEGFVTRTSIDAGERVPPGTQITVWISRGPEPVEPTEEPTEPTEPTPTEPTPTETPTDPPTDDGDDGADDNTDGD